MKTTGESGSAAAPKGVKLSGFSTVVGRVSGEIRQKAGAEGVSRGAGESLRYRGQRGRLESDLFCLFCILDPQSRFYGMMLWDILDDGRDARVLFAADRYRTWR